MVIASLIQCRGEWMNCTFAANLLPLLKPILRNRALNFRDFQYSSYTILPCMQRILTRKSNFEIGTYLTKHFSSLAFPFSFVSFFSFSLIMLFFFLSLNLRIRVCSPTRYVTIIWFSSLVQTPLKNVSRS